jgi:PIN domain nuclease of toxin-antitoxin system
MRNQEKNMLYVLDTHVLIWYFIGSHRLHPKLKEKIDNVDSIKRKVSLLYGKSL